MKFSGFVLVILLLLTLNSCWNANSQLNKAMIFAQQGKFEAAFGLYQQLLRTNAEDPILLNNYGWTLFKADSLEQAEKTLRTAVDLAQNSQQKKMIETNLFMVDNFLSGKWHLKHNNIQEAIRFFQQVTNEYDVKEIGFQYLALCYEALGDFHSAKRNWEKIVAFNAASASRNQYYRLARKKLDSLARKSIESGNYKEAIRIYQQIVAVERDGARGYNNLGWALFLNDELKEAKEILERAKTLAHQKSMQDSINTHLFMVTTFLAGEYSLRQGDYEAALTEFEKVTKRYPETDVGLKYVALCYEGLDEKKKAEQIWQHLAYLYEGNAYHNKYYELAISKLKLELE